MKIVILAHEVARRGAEPAPGRLVFQEGANFVDQCFAVEEIDQPAGFVVANHPRTGVVSLATIAAPQDIDSINDQLSTKG